MTAPEIKLAFASCSPDLIDQFVEEVSRMGAQGLPVFCVSEFKPEAADGRAVVWIPWFPYQPPAENRRRVDWHLRGKSVRYNAILLQPRQPYWPMRWAGLLAAPWRVYCFNENYGHFPLHPRGVLPMVRHVAWRAKNWLRHEFQPGGGIYTMAWRLRNPFSWERPFYAWKARRRGPLASGPLRREEHAALEEGITVVIPSRDGRALLEKALPLVLRESEATRVVIVDNGSSDGTRELASDRVEVLVENHALSFAAAVNKGIRAARTCYVCLLNNDMEIEPGFFAALRAAFDRVPDLFAATAQIFFPAGQRRQETGKAVYWPGEARDLPLRCIEPVAGENDTPVLYGSGGCTLYDTAKLRQIGCFKDAYRPAYVEDLDTGWRGWQRGWPTVFVAGAKVVHHHRATTSRFLSAPTIELAIEQNYLRWILSSVSSREAFDRLWPAAVWRLNLRAAIPEPAPIEMFALRFAAFHKPYHSWDRPAASLWPETEILALGSGQIACFPGRQSAGKPTLIVCTCYLPFPLSHGGAVRMYNLLLEAAKDYEIVLMSFADESAPVAQELLALCREVITIRREGTHARRSVDLPKHVEDFRSEPFAAMLRWVVRRYRPFAVQLEFTQMAQYARDAAPARTILVEHDITLDLYEQMLRDKDDYEMGRELERWRTFEMAAWREADAVVTMSAKDSALIQPAAKAFAIENGVDLERFQPAESGGDPRRLLFIGSFAHLPNLMALAWFLNDVWPRLDGYTLHVIAGKNPDYWLDYYKERVQAKWRQMGVTLEEFVSDVRPAYRAAGIVIAPLRASAGTNIKILEAMAMGKAIVSTEGGVNGLELEAGEDYLLAATPEDFAARIESLAGDAELRRRLERRARRTVEDRFSWTALGAKQRELYSKLYESLRAKAQ
jgi:glycosyltransferase involved in cell wall biosynthesis/GT2 family glycosyltransferase